MKDIWVISDTHFQHYNIIHKFDPPRPFYSTQEMDEKMIENWNRVVKPGDKVYHLGDVFFGNKETFKKLWPRLNGKKRLIVGNHDDVKFLATGGFFEKIMLWRAFKDKKVLLTHVPVHESSIRPAGCVNVHGHTHYKGSPPGPYKSVCAELVNYTPVNLENL